jgi:two-component system alkaline phosphatase synthesis response regulator PhoP
MARILVVEDEPTIALGLTDDLTLEGYEVETFADGAAAFARASSVTFDLILLDVMVPGKDGLTICRELRQAGVRTPIVLLTARSQEADKVLGLDLGADDYVTKPFSPRELVARVRAVMRRAEGLPGASQVFRTGDLQLDFNRFEATRRGVPIALTALEFKLMRTLIGSRGQVLTHDQIVEHVWGKDVFLSDRVIYTHINNLRRKIEAKPDAPALIVGVRGVGYRFDG